MTRDDARIDVDDRDHVGAAIAATRRRLDDIGRTGRRHRYGSRENNPGETRKHGDTVTPITKQIVSSGFPPDFASELIAAVRVQ
ncbi:MAG TPA: hypothetical protein VFW22_13350 [Pseudolabrys sp.]|nr:hypothetical protein [Pseudolabrys sp.]